MRVLPSKLKDNFRTNIFWDPHLSLQLHRQLVGGATAGARLTEALVGNQRRRGAALDTIDIR